MGHAARARTRKRAPPQILRRLAPQNDILLHENALSGAGPVPGCWRPGPGAGPPCSWKHPPAPGPQDDLTGLSSLQDTHRLVDVLQVQLLYDEWPQVDHPTLQQPARPIPGVEDAPAVQCEDGQVLEYHALGHVDSHGAVRYAEQGHSAPVAHSPEPRVDRLRSAAHLQHDVDAEALVGLDQPIGHVGVGP